MFSISAYAQNFETIRYYSKYNEINSDIIYNIEEDKNNNFWLATDNGIIKFNGNTFKKLSIKDGLPSNDIFKIKIDSKNRIWLTGYYSGLYCIYNEKIIKIKNSSNYNAIEFFYEKKDTVFFKNEYYNFITYLTKDNVLKTYNKTNVFRVKSFSNGETEIFKNFTKNTYFITHKNKKITIPNGFVFHPNLSPKYPTFVKDKNISKYHPLNRYVNGDIIFYKEGKWENLNGHKNIKILNTDFENNYIIFRDNKKDRIVVYKDHKLDKELSDRLSYFSTKISKIYYAIIDSKKNIWFVTNDNQLIYIPDNYNQIVSYESSMIFGNNEHSIKYGKHLNEDTFILTNNNHLFKFNLNKKTKKIIDSYHDENAYKLIFRENDFIVCTNKNIYIYDRKSENLIRSVNITPNKNVKIFDNEIYFLKGTSINTLSSKVLEIKNEIRFKDFIKMNNQFVLTNESFIISKSKHEKKHLKRKISFINSINQYGENLIVGTNSNGLYFLNSKLKTKYETSLDENVIDLKVDKNLIYLLTTKSFRVYEINNGSFKLINLKTNFDGLLNPKYTNLDFDDKTIYIFGQNGITKITKRNLEYVPQANIEIDCDQFSTINNTKIVLERENNNLNFKFNINTFDNPDIFKRYIKLNKNKELNKWELTKSKSILIKDLNPGKYSLSFKIESENNNFKPVIKTIYFQIKPFFWETIYFKGFLFILTLLTIYIILKIYKNKIKSKALIIQKMNDLELKALKSQMNPHFIFNTLNSLQSVILTKDDRIVNDFFNKFSKMLRSTLNILNADKVTILDEVNYIKSYLELEQLRGINEFDYFMDIDKNLDLNEFEIPVMMLQPIIENALEHGISKVNHKGEIIISIKASNQNLLISILDNGIGIDTNVSSTQKSKEKSYACKIIQERIKILNIVSKTKYKIEWIDLKSKNQSGTQFNLYIIKK